MSSLKYLEKSPATSSLPPVSRGAICSAVTGDDWRWIVDAHRDNGRRYIVHSDELLSAFLELEETLL
jgi:hypothetical protein